MPVIFSYDLDDATPEEHNRLASLFTRLGWHALGGTAFRYPPLGSTHSPEDWFNNVIPALMLFRAFAVKTGKVKSFTIDSQSSSGFGTSPSYGSPPKAASAVHLHPPTNNSFGKRKLQQWLDAVTFPY